MILSGGENESARSTNRETRGGTVGSLTSDESDYRVLTLCGERNGKTTSKNLVIQSDFEIEVG